MNGFGKRVLNKGFRSIFRVRSGRQGRDNGIALVIVIFALVLVGLLGAALLLSTLSNQIDSADLEAERAAYAQAELGAHAALNILRGHGGPKVPIVTNSINLYIAVNDKNRINPTDTSETPLARLARWLPYSTVKRYTRARSNLSQTLIDTYMVVTDNSRPSEPLGYSLLIKSEIPDVAVSASFPSGTTPAQVKRIRVTSTGYGPRGAVKVIRLQLGSPGGIILPAPFVLNAQPATFEGKVTGSCKQFWDARDYAFSPPQQTGSPIVAYTDPGVAGSFNSYFDGIENLDKQDKKECVTSGITSNPPQYTTNATTLPDWPQNPFSTQQSTQAFVEGLKPYATYRGPQPPAAVVNFGSGANPNIVIIDGTIDLDADKGPNTFTGGGILVITGDLILRTSRDRFSWEGLVLIQGSLVSDSNSGIIYIEGGLVVVPKNNNATINITSDFTLKYNSSYINNAFNGLSIGVMSEY